MKRVMVAVFLILLLTATSFAADTYTGARTGAQIDAAVGAFLTPVAVAVTETGSLTNAQVTRTIVTNYGMAAGGDTTLPATAFRTTFTIVVEAASQAWSLKPPSGEAFVLDGTALDADDEIDLGQTVGNSAILIRVRTGASTYKWYFETIRGTHSDGGAS